MDAADRELRERVDALMAKAAEAVVAKAAEAVAVSREVVASARYRLTQSRWPIVCRDQSVGPRCGGSDLSDRHRAT
jgi:hypothetical protein